MSTGARVMRTPLALRLAVLAEVLLAGAALVALELGRRRSVEISRQPSPSGPVASVVAARPTAPATQHPAARSGVSCGHDGEPDCPLQVWMDQQINTFYTTRARAELAEAFRFLAAQAPPEYPDWVPWAEGGAVAAGRGDFKLAKRACSGCHDDYQERYRTEMRSRPLRADNAPGRLGNTASD